jgi:phosphopantothenoylcysteine decarboxylase / phosphopantothenate---cysteine ligase
MSELQNKEFVLGVTGGIACYKSLEIVRGIKEAGGNVTVVMTKAAMEFVQPLTFQTLSERPVATSMFSMEEESKIGHIKIVENTDAFLIAPATANIIAKAAHGLADDYLSTTLLACRSPIFIAPAMNNNMWENPALQHNLNILESRDFNIIPPESGFLACGTYGPGRMASPESIVERLKSWFESKAISTSTSSALSGISVLITAGPTQEKIDPVRYISNHSSGKMGFALARRCRQLGAKVCLVSGPSSLEPPSDIELVQIISTKEMHHEVMKRAADAQLIIKSAAVSDYRIDQPSSQKIKKTEQLKLNLVKNPDILKELGGMKKDSQFLVGFAAESENLSEYANKKFTEKNLDLIIANNILEDGAGFNVDTNKVLLIDQESEKELPIQSKDAVAGEILNHILASKKWETIKSTKPLQNH